MQKQLPVHYNPLVQNKGELKVQNEGRTLHQFLNQNNTIVLEITKYSASRKTKSVNGWFAGIDDKGNFYRKHIPLTSFSIDKVNKVYIETIEGYKVYFRLACRRMVLYGNISDTFFIDIPEENVICGSNIVNAIKLKVGSQFSPFPIGTNNSDISQYLPYQIINKYNQNQDENKDIYVNNQYGLIPENGKYIFNERITFDESFFKESDSFLYVKDFCNMLMYDIPTFLKLYYFSFTALFKPLVSLKVFYSDSGEFVGYSDNKLILIARDFKSEDKSYLLSIISPYTSINDIKELSKITKTKCYNELNELIFHANHNTLVLNDDYKSNTYAKSQNNKKITELTEFIADRKPINDNGDKYAECNIAILSNRPLTEFECNVERNFMSFNSNEFSKIKKAYSATAIKDIVLKFNKVVANHIIDSYSYGGFDKNFNDNLNAQTRIYFYKWCNSKYTEQLLSLFSFFILTQIINEIFVKYIDKNVIKDLNTCIRSLTNDQLKFQTILQPDSILKSFKENLNQIPFDNEAVRYDELSKSINSDIIYHESEGLLLFDQKKFYNLFLDEFLMSQSDYRKLLADNNYLVSNTKERNFYRLPIGNRKEYIAVPISLLNDEAIDLLPKKSIPPSEWISEQRNYNIYLGNDTNGDAIYWPVDKDLTNKFAVVLGTSGFGKTYWTTKILIKGLHDSGHNVIILEQNIKELNDDAIYNYDRDELKKVLPETYVNENFCFMSECNLSDSSANEILECYIENRNKIFVIDCADEERYNDFLKQLIKYQQSCKKTGDSFEDVFIILDESNNEDTFKNDVFKIIYNQGRKLKINMVTILQYFSGVKSENFRKQIFQAPLKIVFQMNDATVGKLLNEYPNCNKAELKKRISEFERGEAVVFGEFERLDGKIKKGSFIRLLID